MLRKIISHVQSQPRGFATLIEQDVFSDIHGHGEQVLNPERPMNGICRICALEILLWGIRDWWVRERWKGLLDENVMNRKDCVDGQTCSNQRDLGIRFLHLFIQPLNAFSTAHAKECKTVLSFSP